MASVTISGAAAGSVVSIATSSTALAALAQSALDAISARITADLEQSQTYTAGSALPQPTLPIALMVASAASLTLTDANQINAVEDTGTAPVSVTDNTKQPVTIVAGAGGLSVDLTAAGIGGALIVATGGINTINLGTSAATVAAAGNATVNALGGAAQISAGNAGNALIDVAGNDTVNLGGTDTVAFFAAAAALVTAQDGSNVVFSSQSGSATPLVTVAPGTETLGTMAGSTASVTASAGGLMLVSAWGGRTFINPGGANVTVFAPLSTGGGGSETLFGAGDATLPGVTVPAGVALANTGSDFVFGGTGYFHGGTGGLNLLMTSTVAGATTLVGGGTLDLLFSQGAGNSLVGAAGTVIMNAAGFAEPGFSVVGAAGGDVLNAGAANAFMFGSAWGANTIVSGSGTATVFGNHGATGKVGDLYIDGGKSGSLAILDFLPGADTVSLAGDTIVQTTTIAAGASSAPGTSVLLGDGTKIVFVDEFLTQSQLQGTFH